ncbi:MAG: CoA transferase [Nocardioidaceae bacterium]
MVELLDGLRVLVAGSSRPMRVAARWYRDLGAQVRIRSETNADVVDRLWLGDGDPAGDRGHADLLLVEHGRDASGLTGRVTVRYSGSSSTAPKANARLDGRDLAAVGGVAVAVGDPDRPPLPLPDGCIEHMVGSHLVGAGIAALLNGRPEVEVAGADVVAWSVATNQNLYVPYGVDWFRAGRRANGGGGGYPYGVFDVADGQFCLIGRTARDWDVLVDAMGAPGWTRSPRYQDRRAMAQGYPEEVDAMLAPWLQRLTRAELLALAAEHGFPGGPILRPEEVLDVPTLADRWRDSSLGDLRVRSPGRPFEVEGADGGSDTPRASMSDVVVLDLSWVWSGPAAGVMLADLGATVIKIESRTRPDNSRLRGQPTIRSVPSDAPAIELTPYFHGVNRGKRSISLDLTTEEGRAILQRLASQADVIIENLSPGVMQRFGIAPEQVHEHNPGCVYLSLRGYREHPSTEGLRAYAPVLSGGAGIEALVGYEGESPIGMMTYGFSDANAASQGALLALAGLWARRERGSGAAVTLSQLEAAVIANGRNLVASQLPGRDTTIAPFDGENEVVGFDELPQAPWTSPDLFTEVSTPWLGGIPVSRLPWRYDGTLPAAERAGPVIGEYTVDALTGRLGMTRAEIDRLAVSGTLR